MLTGNQRHPDTRAAVAIVSAGLAINVVLALVVKALGLPIYLDTIGTILVTVLLGWRWGVITGLLAVVLGSFFIWPQYFWYVGTAIAIVLTVEVCSRRSLFASAIGAALTGLLVAIAAALVSAPVTAYFEAATFSGNDLITAFFRSMGNSLFQSVILSGFSSEPVDKVLTCLMVYWVVRMLDDELLARYALRKGG